MMLGTADLRVRLTPEKGSGVERLVVVPSPDQTGRLSNGAAALDLRLGRWFLALQQARTSEIDFSVNREVNELEASEGKLHYIPFGQKFIIHPGRFVLGTTLEWMRVPFDLGGHITGRSSIGRRGLVIETAAGLHPNFSGCITLELANCGEVPVAVVPGMRICQVFFHSLSGGSKESSSNFSGQRRPTFGAYHLDPFVANAKQAANPGNMQGNFPL
jgi:dCTP deaminase